MAQSAPPSFLLLGEPPDDRMSAFDPLAGIETEPMNLPSGIATREKSNLEDIASPRRLFLFCPFGGGEKFAESDGRIYLVRLGI